MGVTKHGQVVDDDNALIEFYKDFFVSPILTIMTPKKKANL
jgi:hypothetical protein